MVDATIRPATAEDVPALEGLMIANDPAGPVGPGVEQAYLSHLVARGLVAVAVADADADANGAIVGFGAAVDTGRARHLADLFVLPAAHGRGIGGRLLDDVMGDAWPRTTFGSDDPRAIPLYVRTGMSPLHPNLYLAGDPSRLAAPRGYAIEPVSLERMAELEQAWAGADRRPDLPLWAAATDPRVFVVVRDGREVATGLARRRKVGVGRWVDHLVVAPDADPVPAMVAAIASEAGLAESSGACLLGPSAVVRILLEAGFRIVDHDTYLASDPTVIDPHREIVNTGLL